MSTFNAILGLAFITYAIYQEYWKEDIQGATLSAVWGFGLLLMSNVL